MTMGNMGLSCTLAPTYGWTSKSQSHSQEEKRRHCQAQTSNICSWADISRAYKDASDIKDASHNCKKTFQIWFGTGISNMLQRGQHQRLVLTQMGNQLQAGGQVFKDCFIQCRSYFIPFTVDDKYSTAVFLMTEPKHHLHCNHRVNSNNNNNKFF